MIAQLECKSNFVLNSGFFLLFMLDARFSVSCSSAVRANLEADNAAKRRQIDNLSERKKFDFATHFCVQCAVVEALCSCICAIERCSGASALACIPDSVAVPAKVLKLGVSLASWSRDEQICRTQAKNSIAIAVQAASSKAQESAQFDTTTKQLLLCFEFLCFEAEFASRSFDCCFGLAKQRSIGILSRRFFTALCFLRPLVWSPDFASLCVVRLQVVGQANGAAFKLGIVRHSAKLRQTQLPVAASPRLLRQSHCACNAPANKERRSSDEVLFRSSFELPFARRSLSGRVLGSQSSKQSNNVENCAQRDAKKQREKSESPTERQKARVLQCSANAVRIAFACAFRTANARSKQASSERRIEAAN